MTTPLRFILNQETITSALPAGLPLLDFIREHQRLRGTKIGCREGDCGACTVLVGELQGGQLSYRNVTSCLFPLGNAVGKHVVTIEGLNGQTLTPYQRAMVARGGTQCGFCTVGFVVSLAGFALSEGPHTLDTARAAIDGNICRCTGYKSIERAAGDVAKDLEDKKAGLDWLVKEKYVPGYFRDIASRLKNLTDAAAPVPQASSASKILAGGTDLLVQQPEAMAQSPANLILNQGLPRGVEIANGQGRIGAATTAEELKQSPELAHFFPKIAAHMKLVASQPIRHMATVAGNLVNASPIGDMTIFFLACEAQLELVAGDQVRQLPLRDFYQGYKKVDLAPGEYLRALTFPLPGPKSHFNFEKVSKRTHLDIASVNSAMKLHIENGRIIQAALAAGGVAPVPLFLRKASSFLQGKPIHADTVIQAAALADTETAPISDARGSARYKRLLLRQLIYAHFNACFPNLLPAEVLV